MIQPDEAAAARWHRHFAVQCNNRAWDLIGLPARDEAERAEMVRTAHAAAWHWAQVGSELNGARADVTLAFALAHADQDEPALQAAFRALDFCQNNECEEWDVAFAHAAVALAAAAAGDVDLHAEHYAAAGQWGEDIEEEDDRESFLAEYARIPAPV